jgi:predicted transcriptional regulator
VALAGPAVNVVLAAILFLALVEAAAFNGWQNMTLVGGSFLAKMLWVNLVLAAFNMIPAFPMDGGRVLRALLAMQMDYVRATHIAATVGQALAFVFGFVGLFSNPFLVFIALFVWMGAAGESSMVQIRSALGGIPISRAMITDYQTLAPADTLQSAVEHVLAGFQHDFPVVEKGQLVGVLTRAGLMKTLARCGPAGLVSEAMHRAFETADPAEMLEGVFNRLQDCNCRTIPILRRGQLVGMATLENVGEFLMIQSALKKAGVPGAA